MLLPAHAFAIYIHTLFMFYVAAGHELCGVCWCAVGRVRYAHAGCFVIFCAGCTQSTNTLSKGQQAPALSAVMD